ncbi:hypothetical protein, partial [Achromobacter marplatensis]|uniref:hypothetical protein n=1 Tax=Achromobacter marplatensis TaxID=470868 RepID=UPI00192B169C
MSRAGIQSTRGDGYQTLVAFHWALKIISSPEYEWLEIDSVTRMTDDVVVGRPDGQIICCQCKKNQKNHKPWTIADLADELEKACKTLADPQAVVYFYSRSPFSELLSLKEHFSSYSNQESSEQKLSKPNKKTNEALQTIISRIN